ncbi:MAG: 2,3-bisphosphoglycerate-independent phosphoglycerate mutase [Parvibaculaceae bacterium]|jgi:2,3-bisphosphoglycerate-independent phosphoglycerate mutase
MAKPTHARPVVVALLDGWGHSELRENNAVAQAKTTIFDRLAAKWPTTQLRSSGAAVGLPQGRPGNTQAGHQTLEAGRPLPSLSIQVHEQFTVDSSKLLAENEVLHSMKQRLRSVGGSIHLIGLMSPAGVHGHQQHLAILAAQLSHEGFQVWIHAIMDGEDSPQQMGVDYLAEFLDDIAGTEHAHLATVQGRAYAMDPFQEAAQIQSAYKAIVEADAPAIAHGPSYIVENYAKKINDRDIPPAIMQGYGGVRQDDAILLVNVRPDSASALMQAFSSDTFELFNRDTLPDLMGTFSLTNFGADTQENVIPLFAQSRSDQTLREAVSAAGLTQLHLAETLNQATLNLFCASPNPLPQEQRMLYPTQPRAKFIKKPEGAAFAMTTDAVDAIKNASHDLIVINYAPLIRAAHSGDPAHTRKAVEVLDKCLGKLMAQLEKRDGSMLVTSTHASAEQQVNADTGAVDPTNTINDVPLILMNADRLNNAALRPGSLADLAPTILDILDINQPPAMTGQTLLCSSED